MRALERACSLHGVEFQEGSEVEDLTFEKNKIIGATKPLEAEPGTMRGDLDIDIGRNIIHGSDGEDTAKFEIDLWFNEEELCEWETSDSKWRFEN